MFATRSGCVLGFAADWGELIYRADFSFPSRKKNLVYLAYHRRIRQGGSEKRGG